MNGDTLMVSLGTEGIVDKLYGFLHGKKPVDLAYSAIDCRVDQLVLKLLIKLTALSRTQKTYLI